MNNLGWRINIENPADSVSEKFGPEVAASAFARVGASCFDDLSPSDFEEVFGDLMLMDSDD